MNYKLPISIFQFPIKSKLSNFKSKNLKTNWKLEIGDWRLSSGFTLIELLVSIGILIIIYGIVAINIAPLPSNTLQNASLDTLISDIRGQQTLSMSQGTTNGVYFESGSYTLFSGTSYVDGANGNFDIVLDSGIVLSNVTFPNSTLIFLPGSGDVSGYVAGSDSLTIGSTVTGKTTVIRINKYGATY